MNMSNYIHGFALLLAISLTAVTPAVTQESDLVAEGSRVYGNTCGTCHNTRSPIERTDQQWITIVNHMRVRANLTGRQARAVLAFLQASNGSPSSGGEVPPEGDWSNSISTDPALVELGRELMALKACIGCHVVGGAGGNIGPQLDGVIADKGASFFRQKLVNPTFDNAASLMPNLGLTEEEIDALVAYLATVGAGQTRNDGGS